MSVFGKNKKCKETCHTCDLQCKLHFKHKEQCYCENVECALKAIKMTQRMCFGDCIPCNGICAKEFGHEDPCFCGNVNHQWDATDFPVFDTDREISPSLLELAKKVVEKQKQPMTQTIDEWAASMAEYEVEAGMAIDRMTKMKITVKADAEPVAQKITCVCPWDCNCRGKTCDRRAPFAYQIAEPKIPDERTSDCHMITSKQTLHFEFKKGWLRKSCEVCSKTFEVRKCHNYRACSRLCGTKLNWASSKQTEKWSDVSCFTCKQLIHKLKSKVNKHNFCSRICRSQGMSILHQTHEVKSNVAKGIKQGIYTTKDDRKIKYDSSYELRRMRDFDYKLNGIFSWERCNFSIPWVDSLGKSRSYNPDFSLIFDDGSRVIEEVKGKFDEETLLQIEAGKKFCEERGWRFQLFCRTDFGTSPEVKTKVYTNDYGSFSRPTLEYVFMTMALALAERSTCLRKKVGVVFTDSRMQHAPCLGYNGDEAGGKNQCDSLEPGKCNCIHAEINALTKNNFDISGGTCFVTLAPCSGCAKILVNRQIKRVIYYESYRNSAGIQLLQRHNIEVIKYAKLQDSFDDTL